MSHHETPSKLNSIAAQLDDADDDGASFDEVERALNGYAERDTECIWGDFGRCAEDNMTRAAFGLIGLRAFGEHTGVYPYESVATAMGDLLNNLRHLADLAGIDWGAVNNFRPYEAEIRGMF
ncbi:hypothetical protein SEA_BANTAM_150 [Gordonia phage Bantam]|uniref:MazG-like nucleotide pyrophosphohydrolase n=1 Tax=Gordonia phage Bantam TaxID=1887641 RepID=A0A1B3AYJ0_9CAUD|nr:hypothetical protein BIZ77_gp029 [Gordonia phage Bantam]AOE43839.1 hypothetical protein SEA_BANTAM_150 [Gordonia phage Bantam]